MEIKTLFKIIKLSYKEAFGEALKNDHIRINTSFRKFKQRMRKNYERDWRAKFDAMHRVDVGNFLLQVDDDIEIELKNSGIYAKDWETRSGQFCKVILLKRTGTAFRMTTIIFSGTSFQSFAILEGDIFQHRWELFDATKGTELCETYAALSTCLTAMQKFFSFIEFEFKKFM